MSKNKKETYTKNDSIEKPFQKSRNQSSSKIQAKTKEILSLPQIIPSTEKLKMKIDQFKTQQLQLAKTLEETIKGNLKYRSNSASQIQKYKHSQFLDKKHKQKQKSLVNLKRNFQKRIEFNNEANLRLQKMQEEITIKKEAVARKLSLIQAQNFQKIKEIEQFEKSFLAQVKIEMMKNFEKQKKLKMQYDKISKEDSKLIKVKQQESRLDDETWKQIVNLKLNLQGLMANQKKRQNRLVQEKDVEILKKQEKIINFKQEQKKAERKRVKLDPKQAGKQYLDFAKKRGSVGTKSQNKLRKDYMNLKLKVINYDNPILDIISNNDGILSKVMKKQQQNLTDEKTKISNITQEKIKEQIFDHNEFQNDIIPILQSNQQQQQNKQISENSQFSDLEGIHEPQRI